MDLERFRSAALHRPTEEVELPELRGILFDEGERPVLHVRGLEFNEQQLANEQLLTNSIASALHKAVDKAQAGDLTDLVDITSKLLGAVVETRTAPETVYRIEIILRATVDGEGQPFFKRQDVVRLAKHFPTSFKKLSDRINALSGKPSNLGESSNGTGQIIASAPQ